MSAINSKYRKKVISSSINKDNKVTYVEYVPEVTQAVNFDAALEAIKADI